MKKIGIVICNYNKKEYVLKCIESLQRQTFRDFEIFAVDNASTDGSAEAVAKAYGKAVHLLQLPENLGGTGGFNQGLRQAMAGDFDGFLLLDNDVVLKEDCLEHLVSLMNSREEIGILGCKILRMDEPDTIQEFGPVLDPENVNFILRYRGEKDSLPQPDVLPCDYVPACAMLVRREVVERIGLMPEENFIYYDDIEWCYRCRQAGWQVAAANKAKAWHKGGAGIQTTTFSVYYINRNKTEFYMRYFPEKFQTEEEKQEAIRHRADVILRDMFEGNFVCKQQGQLNVLKTRMDAFLDALEGKKGKAEDWKIRPHEHTYLDRFKEVMGKAKKIALYTHGDEPNTSRILAFLRIVEQERGEVMDITLVDRETQGENLFGLAVLSELPGKESDYDYVLHVCRHVYKLEIEEFDACYVDGWGNLMLGAEDFEKLVDYRKMLDMFVLGYRERMVQQMTAMSVELQEKAPA